MSRRPKSHPSARTLRRALRGAFLLGLVLLATPAAAQVHEKAVGDYLVRANLVAADALPDATRTRHGLDEASALLNVVVLERGEPPRRTVRASLAASAEDLTGRPRPIPLHEVVESGRISYLGAVPARAPRAVRDIAIEVRAPDGAGATLRFRDTVSRVSRP